MSLSRQLIAFSLAFGAFSQAYASQVVRRTGFANGAPCEVSYRIEANGYVSGINVSGISQSTQSGFAPLMSPILLDYMEPQTYARLGLWQTPMLVDQGTVLRSYVDTGFFTAEELKFDIYGPLEQPVSVNYWSAHLQGPLVKVPVRQQQLSCAYLR